MDFKEKAFEWHKKTRGKFNIKPKVDIKNTEDLAIVYTPGVAEAVKAIAENKENVYRYTVKENTVAVITDGSAVLGLGNVGPEASLPVMEGKAVLFKAFANIDAFPIALAEQDVKKTIETVRNIAPVFGGINLEDIKAPECFEIEAALQDIGIPVMHDDQHGTAVVVLAALINALKVVDKKKEDVRLVLNGAGAASYAILNLLILFGFDAKNVVVLDSRGTIYEGRDGIAGNPSKEDIAGKTNPTRKIGSLKDVLEGVDVFIGVSVASVLTGEMISLMAKNPIVIAMANPVPEIMPNEALAAGAAVVATGRSDFPNQVNNVLAFPGIFRGALDVRASRITDEMKLAAAKALAGLVENPTATEIIPSPIDKRVVSAVAEAVKFAWNKYR